MIKQFYIYQLGRFSYNSSVEIISLVSEDFRICLASFPRSLKSYLSIVRSSWLCFCKRANLSVSLEVNFEGKSF